MINKLSLFIILSFFSNIHSIYDLNTLKDEAEEAFLAKEYQIATNKYTAVLKQTHSEACQLNMAHAFLLNQDTNSAIESYQQTFMHQIKQSIASSQLGVITFEKTGITNFKPLSKKEKEPVLTALNYFKNALKQDVTNEKARYNYEILKYLLEQKEPENQEKNKDNQDQNEENKEKEQENKENQENQNGQENKDQKENDSKQDQEGKDNDENQENQQDQEGKEDKNSKKEGQESKDGKPENEEDKEGENKENPTENDQTKKEEEKEETDKNGTKNEQQKNQKDKNDKIIDERLKAQKMTKEQAQKLLNSTTQQETKYIQQIKKQGDKKQQSNSKNDW